MNSRHNDFRMTDELERQLMLQAIEEQFRPRPLRALRNAAANLAESIRATVRDMAEARRHSSQTHLM